VQRSVLASRGSRPLILAAVAALAASLFSVAAPAQDQKADPKVEKEARDLQKKAIEQDNLATDYEKASQKLNQALQKCGDTKCSPALRGELLRDLGAMQILNKKKDEGLASFGEALKLAPTLALSAEYKTPELEALWEQAKKPAEPTPPPAAAEPEKPRTPRGDFTHTAAPQQLIRTPIPIYVEYKGQEQLVKVIARYKPYGSSEFKTLELQKMGGGWGALIPCEDAASVGPVQYYLQGYNANNDPVATSGNRNTTFKVAVTRDKVEGEEPHLPGKAPPAQCRETDTCPPGFPGCPDSDENVQAVKKGDGAECDENAQCASNVCRNGMCKGGGSGSGGSSSGPGKFKRFWVGVSGAVDFLPLPSAEDVCLRTADGSSPVNSQGYDCTTTGGKDYMNADNANIRKGAADKVDGGFSTANVRVMATFDYALNPNILVGARLGYVFGAYPDKFASSENKGLGAPIHAEVRGTYLFGKDALTSGFAPFVFVGGGVTEFASKVDVTVQVIPDMSKPNDPTTDFKRKRQAWYVAGPGFVSGGVGLRYAITPRIGASVAGKFTGAFGGVGFVPILSPELSVQYGF
jgi:hypothetical protein